MGVAKDEDVVVVILGWFGFFFYFDKFALAWEDLGFEFIVDLVILLIFEDGGFGPGLGASIFDSDVNFNVLIR